MMNNKEIYKKTIGFSVRRLIWDVVAVLLFVVMSAIGYVVMESTTNKGLIGLAIGVVVGAVAVFILLRYIAFSYKAGQIAMMTKGIVEKKLSGDVIAQGKQEVKGRFPTVAAYFAATGVIKGVFDQVGVGITAVGNAVGGDAGGAIGGTISSAVKTVVEYLCDCCLGWVFYRKNEKAGRATCEGAVIFFKHGKALVKNLGRIFGMSILSFVVIGGAFTGIFYLIMANMNGVFSKLSAEVIEAAARANKELPAAVSDPNVLALIAAAICGIVLWGILHATFVKPFILVGVLRNFITAGMKDTPSE
ncbi:hypothetical protein IJ096_01205, partial [Candidatus Saccharibacteria bacterium]|nr:hypothetical protein [Candidatus Saccharibacteria bacterium]